MTIITAGTTEYAPMIRQTMANAEQMGYRVLPFDLGGLGFGNHFDTVVGDFDLHIVPAATFKPRLIQYAISHNEDNLFVWLDGDAVPISPFDDLLLKDFDVAVTLREDSQVGKTGNSWTDYLNSGVLFFRPTCATKDFLCQWINFIDLIPSDQASLNEVVGQGWTIEQWKDNRNCIVTVNCGARVLILDALEWNYWHWPIPVPKRRILHYKRGVRGNFR